MVNVVATVLGHLSQSSGWGRLHPGSYERPNPSVEVPHLAETVTLDEILLIEEQHNAPACPDKHLLIWWVQQRKKVQKQCRALDILRATNGAHVEVHE